MLFGNNASQYNTLYYQNLYTFSFSDEQNILWIIMFLGGPRQSTMSFLHFSRQRIINWRLIVTIMIIFLYIGTFISKHQQFEKKTYNKCELGACNYQDKLTVVMACILNYTIGFANISQSVEAMIELVVRALLFISYQPINHYFSFEFLSNLI